MSNEVDLPEDDPTESKTGGNNSIQHIQEQLFQHSMVLKQHSHQIGSAQDRMTLLMINTLSSVFFIITVLIGASTLAGVLSPAEGFVLIENMAYSFGIIAALFIGLSNALVWWWDLLSHLNIFGKE